MTRRAAKMPMFCCTVTPIMAYYAYRDGLHIFNPGSLGSPKEPFYPTYGTIDIQGKSIVFNHVPLEERDR